MGKWLTCMILNFGMVCGLAHGAEGGEYWKVIKGYLSGLDRVDDVAAEELLTKEMRLYIEALADDALFEAGRQCAREADLVCPETVVCEAADSRMLGFFYHELGRRGVSGHHGRLMLEIGSKDNSNFWRVCLVGFLDDTRWAQSWQRDQVHALAETLLVVMRDPGTHVAIRKEASQTIRGLLGVLEHRNFVAEPALKRRLERDEDMTALQREIDAGKIKVSRRFQNEQDTVIAQYRMFAETLVCVVGEAAQNRYLEREVLGALYVCLTKPIKLDQQLSASLVELIRNFDRYHPSNWPSVAVLAKEHMTRGESLQVSSQILARLQEMHENAQQRKDKAEIQGLLRAVTGIAKTSTDQ